MGLLDETVSVPRRTMTLFFLIDTSGSMEGNKIGAVNDAVVNVLPMLNDISETNPDAEIKVAALEFSSGVNWLCGACAELAAKLSRNGGFMQSASGSFAPAIILLSDGGPTDNYDVGLAKLQGNNWFKSAIKIAIAIGDDADKDVLKQFTGNSEAVITVHNIDALKQIIRVVAVTSSQIGSKSSTAGDVTKQDQVIKDVQDAAKNIDGADTADSTSTVDSSQYIDDWG